MSLPPWISGKRKGSNPTTSNFPGESSTSKVPNAKKPKARPPRGLRDTLAIPIVRSLPNYSGPYHVGTMEIEVPVREPRTFSHITRKKQHILQLKTVLVTIYYPASPPTSGEKPSRQLWLGRARLSVAQGYSHFAKLGSLGIPIFLPTMFTKLPAWRNAPLSDRLPPNAKPAEGPKAQVETPKFPLMIFSHGLGGTKTAYSSVCGEFASYGFVVIALEHRDGSGPRSFINQPDNVEIKLDKNADYSKDKYHDVKHKRDRVETRYDVVDYIFPKGNAWDTSPTNEKGVDHELRGAQIDLRLAEIEEAYEVIRKINDGEGAEISTKNMRRKSYKSSSSHGLEGVDWAAWKGRVQMDHVVAAGHSFGAATVVDMLRNEERFNWVSQGIIYDIWGGGTRPPDTDEHKITAPICAINSEAFTYWSKNFKLVESLVEEANPCPAWLLTVRGTIHVNQSDFSLLYPDLCSLALKMTADPQRAIDININASLEFLSMVMPGIPEQMEAAFPKEGLLCQEEAPLENIPMKEQHRPKNEVWIGGRLSIPHEFWWRVMPSAARKLNRSKTNASSDHSGDEVWVHKRPDEGTIQEYSDHTKGSPRGCGKPCSDCKPQSVACNQEHSKGKHGHEDCEKE